MIYSVSPASLGPLVSCSPGSSDGPRPIPPCSSEVFSSHVPEEKLTFPEYLWAKRRCWRGARAGTGAYWGSPKRMDVSSSADGDSPAP